MLRSGNVDLAEVKLGGSDNQPHVDTHVLSAKADLYQLSSIETARHLLHRYRASLPQRWLFSITIIISQMQKYIHNDP